MNLHEVEALCHTVPAWRGFDLVVAPLAGGITNRNYTVDVDGRRYVVRVAGERTEVLGIDRAHEAEAAGRAATLGIGPPVLGPLPGHATLITQMVGGSHATDNDDFVGGDRLERVTDVLKTFHESGALGGQFPIFRVVEWHARDAVKHGVTLPVSYEGLHRRSAEIEAAFAAMPMPTVACHNDLLPANVLFDNETVWLLDYEYAGMNERFFDLANLSVNSAFSEEADERLLRRYFGAVTARFGARLHLMKIMSEFREAMWAVVQQGISTLDFDFAGYARERFENCLQLCAQSTFRQYLLAAAEPSARK